MPIVDRTISRVVLGACAPVVLMLAGWWGSLGLFGDGRWIPWAALAGAVSGAALDLTVLRKRLDSLYSLSIPSLALVAVFYSGLIYGFFMGLPVPDLLVGVGLGFVIGRRHTGHGIRTAPARAEVRAVSWTATAIMFALCCATAWIALTEPTIASQVRGMLGLSFTPSMDALRALALLGGAGLVAGGYVSTTAAAKWAARSASICA